VLMAVGTCVESALSIHSEHSGVHSPVYLLDFCAPSDLNKVNSLVFKFHKRKEK
jgi:hypothetical protein